MNHRASIAVMLQTSTSGARRLRDRAPISFTTPTYLFQTYPKRWMDYYSSAGLVLHDPTVHWGLSNLGHIRWVDLEAIDPKGVLERAKDFGIMSGVAIAVLISGSRSIASFARADREYDDARWRNSRICTSARPSSGDTGVNSSVPKIDAR